MKRYKRTGSTISVYLENEIIDKLDKVADELNESRSYVIRSIILNATREVNRNEERKYYTPCNWNSSIIYARNNGIYIYYCVYSNG